MFVCVCAFLYSSGGWLGFFKMITTDCWKICNVLVSCFFVSTNKAEKDGGSQGALMTPAAVCAFKMSADHPVKNGAVSDQTEHKNVSELNDLCWRTDWEKSCLLHNSNVLCVKRRRRVRKIFFLGNFNIKACFKHLTRKRNMFQWMLLKQVQMSRPACVSSRQRAAANSDRQLKFRGFIKGSSVFHIWIEDHYELASPGW